MSYRTCRECRSNNEHSAEIREYRVAKRHHKEQTHIANTFGGFVAATGIVHTLIRTLDTWNLPTRMYHNGEWYKADAFQKWAVGERRANFVVSSIFGVACLFWAKAWHHKTRAIMYKEKLSEFK